MRCFWRIGWANVQWWGALFTAVGLTNGKIDGGAARTDGGEGELCGTSATRRRAATADAKNAESALRKTAEARRTAKRRGVRWRANGNRQQKSGGLCNQSGRFSTKRGVVSAERRKLSVESGERWAKLGTF